MYERWPSGSEEEREVEDVIQQWLWANAGCVGKKRVREYEEEREKKGGESSPVLQNVSATYFPPCPSSFSLSLSFFYFLLDFSLSLFRSRRRRSRLGASRCSSCVRAVCVQLVYDAGIEAKFARRWWKPDITLGPCHPSRHVSRTGWIVPVPTHTTARSPPSNDTRASVVRESQLSFSSSSGFFPPLPLPSFLDSYCSCHPVDLSIESHRNFATFFK